MNLLYCKRFSGCLLSEQGIQIAAARLLSMIFMVADYVKPMISGIACFSADDKQVGILSVDLAFAFISFYPQVANSLNFPSG